MLGNQYFGRKSLTGRPAYVRLERLTIGALDAVDTLVDTFCGILNVMQRVASLDAGHG